MFLFCSKPPIWLTQPRNQECFFLKAHRACLQALALSDHSGAIAALEHRALNRTRRPDIVTPECASAHIRGRYKSEAPFAIPDTTQASFRDDEAPPQDCAATDSGFAHSALD